MTPNSATSSHNVVASRHSALRHGIALVLLAAITAAVLVHTLISQPMLSHRGGLGWDGVHYQRMAEQVSLGQQPSENRPNVYRIGTPALVGALHAAGWVEQWTSGFRIVNLVFGCLNVVLVYAIIALLTGPAWGLAGASLYAMHWISPLRLIVFSPVLTDPAGITFIYLGVLFCLALSTRSLTLSLSLAAVVFVGTLFREIVAVLPLIYLLSIQPAGALLSSLRQRHWRRLAMVYAPALLPLLGVAGAYLVVRLLVHVETAEAETFARYGFGKQALFIFWTNSPQFFLHALFTSFGLLLLFPLLKWRALAAFLQRHRVLLATLAIMVPLAYIGGRDIERYINWAYPFVFVLIAKAIDAERPSRLLLLSLLAFTAVFACRLPWPIPDYGLYETSPFPVFTFLSSAFRYQDLFVLNSDKLTTGKIFYEYLAAATLLTAALRWTWLSATARRLLRPAAAARHHERDC